MNIFRGMLYFRILSKYNLLFKDIDHLIDLNQTDIKATCDRNHEVNWTLQRKSHISTIVIKLNSVLFHPQGKLFVFC